MVDISYAVSVCNEHQELDFLLNLLLATLLPEDEIVIIVDVSNTTIEVARVIESFRQLNVDVPVTVLTVPLNKDFANFKNSLKNACTKEFIFFIDADEYPSNGLLESIKTVLMYNNIDILSVPRVNVVHGLTAEHIAKWQWNVNERGWVNWPDYQTRICRNSPDIYWRGKVHETLAGWKISSQLPADDESWALYHIKDIARQERQNEFYSTI